MTPAGSIEEAFAMIDAVEETASTFELAVDDSLQDPVGMNIAVIVDAVLAKGFVPDGYEQRNGYRIYKYKEFA